MTPTQPAQTKVPAWKAYFNRLARDPAVARLRGQVEKLLADLDVVIPLEHGDVDGAAYELLKRRKDADPKELEAIDFILTHRRLLDAGETFSPPRSFRLLGTGTQLHGPADYDPSDKTFLATRRLTLLGIPILILGAYRVTRDQKGRLLPLSRVPLEPHLLAGRRIKRRLVFAVLALAVLGGLFVSRPDMVSFSSLPSALHIVNGLEFPVSVAVGDETVNVPALGHVSHPLKKEYYHLVAHNRAGEIMEEENVDNASGEGVFTYNILGVAPLYTEVVSYAADGIAERSRTWMALQRTQEVTGVHGVFVAVPDQVRVPFWKEAVERRFVEVGPGGWLDTVRALENVDDAWTVLTRTIVADPENEAAYRAGVDVLYAMEPRDAIQAARMFYSNNWDSTNAQRMLMWTMIRAAGREGAVDAYQQLQKIEPATAIGALLTAQVELPEAAAKRLVPAVKLYSKDYFLRLELGRAFYLLGRFEDAVREFETLEKQNERAIRSCYREHALSLIALGKRSEAAHLVANAGDLDGFPVDFEFARFYATVTAGVSTALKPYPFDHYLDRSSFYHQDEVYAGTLFRALTSRTVPDQEVLDALANDTQRNLVHLAGVIASDLDLAVALTRDLPLEALRKLDDVSLILLAGEFLRRGAEDDAGVCLNALRLWAPWRSVVVAALKEQSNPPEVLDLDLEIQAALKLVQARRLGKAHKEFDALIKEARRLDVVSGIVTAAIRWPISPLPGQAPATQAGR